MKPKRLLAKSSVTPDNPCESQLLCGHTSCVIASARQLLDHRGLDALHAAGLNEAHRGRFERWVLAGAFLHDLGKASDHSQEIPRGRRTLPQLVRHEACSLYLAWPGQPLGGWLVSGLGSERDLCFASMAAAGHHRRFWRDAIAPHDSGAGTSLTLWTSHDDFHATLRLGAEALGLAEPLSMTDVQLVHGRRSKLHAFFERCEAHALDLRPSREERLLIALAKAFVLAADVAGSAVIGSESTAAPDWIGTVLGRRRDPADLERLVHARLAGHALRPFQLQVAASREPATLVRAGCGAGKTVAAYLWAARSHPGRTLWVTYPTTGTATEGFRDYVSEAHLEGRLDHSRAAIDLRMMGLGSPGHTTDPRRDIDRLDALRAWDMDVVTCTVDTVLGLVQNQRKGLYAFASLIRGALVFDEIHAYDGELFGALLRFVAALPGIPTLLMTASLPDERFRALSTLVRDIHRRPLAVIDGPEDLERLPRYRRVDGDPHQLVKDTLRRGGKVLWVSNTVDRCIDAGMRGAGGGVTPLIYHSRFRYVDRVLRHRAIVDAFKGRGAAFASATQVAEMSLDISANLLVTDNATIPALIQRLGRLNRASLPGVQLPVASFMVIKPPWPSPYDERELARAREWLTRLGNRDLSQRDLIDAWTSADEPLPTATRSAWLDGVFETVPAGLREPTPGITVVRAQDLPRIEAARDPHALASLTIPMGPPPAACVWREWPRAVRVYPIAPADAIDYDPMRGARWRD